MKTQMEQLAARLAQIFNDNLERPCEESDPEYKRAEVLAMLAISLHPQGGRVLALPTHEELQYMKKLAEYAVEDGAYGNESWMELWCALVNPEDFCVHCAATTIYCPRQFEEVAALLNEWTALLHKEGLI